jgi:hypothetical protein
MHASNSISISNHLNPFVNSPIHLSDPSSLVITYDYLNLSLIQKVIITCFNPHFHPYLFQLISNLSQTWHCLIRSIRVHLNHQRMHFDYFHKFLELIQTNLNQTETSPYSLSLHSLILAKLQPKRPSNLVTHLNPSES